MTALASVLDRLKLFEMPQGGSITLVMLPILFIAFRRGLRAGLLTGFLVGLIQLLIGGYFLNPLQVLFDYLLAMTAVGTAGLFRNKSLKNLFAGTLLASALRLLSNFISGVVYYGSYAPKGTPVWLYSLLYNSSYILPAATISFLVLVLLWKFQRQLFEVK
jgi:thiamine transporter